MTIRKTTRLIREGDYLAEVEIDLHDDPPGQPGWGPYLTPDAVRKLEVVQLALRQGDFSTASKQARIFHVTPVSAA